MRLELTPDEAKELQRLIDSEFTSWQVPEHVRLLARLVQRVYAADISQDAVNATFKEGHPPERQSLDIEDCPDKVRPQPHKRGRQ